MSSLGRLCSRCGELQSLHGRCKDKPSPNPTAFWDTLRANYKITDSKLPVADRWKAASLMTTLPKEAPSCVEVYSSPTMIYGEFDAVAFTNFLDRHLSGNKELALQALEGWQLFREENKGRVQPTEGATVVRTASFRGGWDQLTTIRWTDGNGKLRRSSKYSYYVPDLHA